MPPGPPDVGCHGNDVAMATGKGRQPKSPLHSRASEESGYTCRSAPQTPAALSIQGDRMEIVRRNFPLLKEGICYDTMVDLMLSCFCISQSDRDEMEQTKSLQEKSAKLIKCLVREHCAKPAMNVCEIFLMKLRDCPLHSHLYEMIKSKGIQAACAGSAARQFCINVEAVRTHCKALAEEIDPKVISDHLYANKILSDVEHDEIMCERQRLKKCHKLLFIVEKKTDAELDVFMNILEEQQPSVIDIFTRTHQEPKKVDKADFTVQKNFRYVVDTTTPFCDIMLDTLISKDAIDDGEKGVLDTLTGRRRTSKMTKFVIQRGKNCCRKLLAAYDSPELDSKFIVEELVRRRQSQQQNTVRRPRADLQKVVIQTYWEYLMEDLVVQPLLDALLEESLIDIPGHDTVEEENSRRDKSRVLLSLVDQFTPRDFVCFVWTLENNDYNHIVVGLQDPRNIRTAQADSGLHVVVVQGSVHTHVQGRIPDGRYFLRMSAVGGPAPLRRAVEHSMREAVEHSEDDLADLCLQFSHMSIDDVSNGSVIIHLHPVTDSALEKLLDAERNGTLAEFVKAMLEKNNIGEEFAGQVVEFDIELVPDKEGLGHRKADTFSKPDAPTIHQIISQNKEYLRDELEAQEMAKILKMKQILTEEECEQIKASKVPRKQKVDRLLTMVLEKMKSSKTAAQGFVDVLGDLDYTHVLEHLRLVPKDCHSHAEQVRRGVIEHYSALLEELGTDIIQQVLKRGGASEGVKKSLELSGGKRRRRLVHDFLKVVLDNDEMVCEFEEIMIENGLEKLMSVSPSAEIVRGKMVKEDTPLPPVLLKANFRVSFHREPPTEPIPPPSAMKTSSPTIVVKAKEPHFPQRQRISAPMAGTSRDFGTSWSGKRRKLVAAIDFGTTYSGAAFSFSSDKDKIWVVKKRGLGTSGHLSEKMPTALLMEPSGEVLFGWEAEEKYKQLTEDEEHLKYRYFRRFKMALHKSENLCRETEILDTHHQPMLAMEVFTLSIVKLKEKLLHLIERRSKGAGSVAEEEIFWVITVPAIWGDKAKQFMREAAGRAGISSHRLILALEPEAAALFVKSSRLVRKEDRLETYSPGKKYLVIDLGGGTGDLTSMQVTKDLGLKQLYQSCGGRWGGETVNEEFWAVLEKVFGSDVIERFKLGSTYDYLDLDGEFETKKRRVTEYSSFGIRLPTSLTSLVKAVHGKSAEELVMHKDLTKIAQVKADKLILTMDTMRSLFDNAIHRLIDESHGLVDRDTDIIMVGGFSQSPLIQRAMKEAYPGNRVIIPQDSDLAVLKGAVYYGHNPDSITARICKFTYGLGVLRYFLEGDPKNLKKLIDGRPYCTGVFAKVVTIGEEIGIGDSRCSEDITGLVHSAMSMTFNIYRSTERDPQYVTDAGCEKIGQIKVNITEKQEIKVWMKFGETELIVEGRDASTNKLVEGAATLDLLAP